jgi:hypothetical protein
MPFEPQFPSPFGAFFQGQFQAQVTDPHGQPAATIISMKDDWHLQVTWQVTGALVPSIGGKWQIRAYLESIGPGPEVMVANREVDITGANNYSETFFIGPNVPNIAGPYKLVTVLTSTNLLGLPAPFAAYDEGPLLQFFAGDSI